MDLLPKSHTEFGTEDYWEKFFKNRGNKSFEWYGEFGNLCGVIHKYVKQKHDILVVGCGNSRLSADMYDVGYKTITNIDISDTVIRQMKDMNKIDRPDMKFIRMDIFNMEFPNNTFNFVIDKGTLDAILVDDSEAVLVNVTQMFNEVDRVLQLGGRYICITLAQDHILKKLVEDFAERGWPIRVHRVEPSEDTTDFHMPVFVFIVTKFNKLPGKSPILEACYFDERTERLSCVPDLISVVKEMQHYGVLRQSLSKRSTEEEISVDLMSPVMHAPRYTLYIIDGKPKKAGHKFAIFIVPQGRETDWIYSTKEGRRQVHDSAGFQRLIIVTFNRRHSYRDMAEVKSELSGKVMELKPADLSSKTQVPFLSVGVDDIGSRTIKFQGRSEFSDEYIIEDVKVNNDTFRRLVFLKHPNIIQSEMKLTEVRKTRGKQKKQTVLDHTYLSCAHHLTMTAGLAFLEIGQLDSKIKLLLVGLGGGNLPMFIHRSFPAVALDVVDIDRAMADVARDWFGFQEDDTLRVHIDDGTHFIKQAQKSGMRYDVVMFDVDSKDASEGMGCPPAAFIETDFLITLADVLKDTGVFVLNLACRNTNLRDSTINDLKSVFKGVWSVKIPEDLNEIIFAKKRTAHDPDKTLRQSRDQLTILNRNRVKETSDSVNLSEEFNDLEIL